MPPLIKTHLELEMKSLFRAAALAAAILSPLMFAPAALAAPITVVSYTGNDGKENGYGYDDRTYSGARVGTAPYYTLSGGTGDLTDGLSEQHVTTGYALWEPYVMWEGFSPVLVFDLGQSHNVDTVNVSFIDYPSAGVYIPTGATVRFSNDGSSWGSVINRTFTTGERTLGDDQVATYDLLGGTGGQGRYAEIQLITAGVWTGISEVSFTGNLVPAPVPEPSVLALMAAGGALMLRRRKV